MMPYILHAGLIMAACLVFYKILLQKETFFRLNRYLLVACLLVSFAIPFIEVPQQWSFRTAESATPVVALPTDFSAPGQTPAVEPGKTVGPVTQSTNIDWGGVLFTVYWVGVIIFAINFLVQLVVLLFQAYTRPVIKDGKFRIVELSGDKAPCSFGNNIFINPEKYDWETYNQILQHEKIHVEERHTLDLILAELAVIFQWFNPFAWWYRKELENNLEFLTDDRFLHHAETERTSYQMSLVKVSAPHLPLSLTTNYNQSLLKKRVAMMNAKKSNVHTTWKYLFLFPLLVLTICLLNKPVAMAQAATSKKEKNDGHGIPTEGYWFATIKGEKVNMQFKADEDGDNHNSTTFQLSDFKNMPREGSGTFTITRDAGTVEFTGKLENNQGMGRYKFKEDKAYASEMKKEGIEFDDEREQFVFFMVDVKKSYIPMLKRNGYSKFDKDQLIPLAALDVNESYIQSLKKAGIGELSLNDLVPLKAVGVTSEYVDEIRKAGYPNVTAEKLITFKAQNIDAKYIADIRKAGMLESKVEGKQENENKNESKNDDNNENETSTDNLVAFKALNIDEAYIASIAAAGYKNLSGQRLISFKGLDIDADYIRSWTSAGYKDISPSDLVALKAQDINPAYLKSFSSVGYSNVPVQKSISLKAIGVTPEFIKGFKDLGYDDISLDDVIGLKAQDATPALVKEYSDLGFSKVSINDIVAAKATGTTPSFIKSMKEKGHNLKSLQKYITLKTVVED
jgi:hypothetical protein